MKLKHLLIGMLAFVAAVSCKEDQPVETPTLKVSETSLSFAAEGGEKSFNLTANLDWTATPDADWLSVEPTSGKGSDKATAIKVTADENTTAEARTATVKVKAGALSETISVTQAKKEATEPEQPEQPKAATIKDFVKEYVKIIDVWTNNVGVVNVVGGIGAKNDANDVQNAHYVPDDTKVVVGDVEYTLADAVELASRSYLLLRGYDGNDTKTFGRNLPIAKLEKAYTLDDALPATHSYTWGQYPYAERTNGGDFKMVTSEGEFELMKVDILDDYSHRHTNFPGQGGALSNFCSYTGGYLAGYDGCCCVKRIMMAYAHFFKYMLDNNLKDATGVSADQTFDAPLFGVATEPEQPEQPSVPAIEAGPYWIMGTKDNVTKVMSPLAAEKTYGYAPSEEAVDGKSYAKNVFTFAAVEGGFTIADASGRYYYQEKGTTYKTFNAGTDGTLAGCVWTVTKNDDGTYAIVNKESGKTIRYAEGTYTSFGVYTDAEANGSVLVNLVKADNPLEENPDEPEQPAQDGTEANPYLIASADDMLKIKEHTVPGQTTFFKMTADVDMASVKEWETVNYSEDENFGRLVNFDGDNHTISNFAPETFTGKYPSLFGIFAGTIKNVKFVGANIVGKGGPSAVIGGYLGNASKQLAAHIENVSIQGTFTTAEPLTRFGAFGGLVYNTTFINCQADVTMTSEREDMGAFAGQATGEIVMKNCAAKVNMTNTRGDNAHRTGGLIGYLQASATVGTFENCSVEGVIKDAGADTKSHSAFIGGLFGWAGLKAGSKLIVKNCHSSVNIESNEWSNNIGGLIGNCGDGVLEMTGCYSTGSIVGGQQVGGLIGLFEKAYGTVTDSYYTGTINCGAKNYVGGIVGRITAKDGTVTFTNCHSTGAITGGSSCAGILGAVDAASPAVDFIKCYATGDITGASNTGGIVGFHNGGVIKNCWYEGKIVGRGSVGGIAGTAYTTLIENSYVNSDMVVSSNLAGGIFGQIHASTVSFEMKNCYATGNIEAGSGVGGLIGNLGVKTTAKIENCFSWAAKLISLKGADPTNYTSGAIIANIGNNAKVYPESYIAALRNPALEFVDYCGSYPDATAGPETMTNTLCDHDDIVKDNLPPVLVPQDKGYKNDWAQRPYHGKAAAAGATPCSIAKAFGWDETVWDLSGTLPKLK